MLYLCYADSNGLLAFTWLKEDLSFKDMGISGSDPFEGRRSEESQAILKSMQKHKIIDAEFVTS